MAGFIGESSSHTTGNSNFRSKRDFGQRRRSHVGSQWMSACQIMPCLNSFKFWYFRSNEQVFVVVLSAPVARLWFSYTLAASWPERSAPAAAVVASPAWQTQNTSKNNARLITESQMSVLICSKEETSRSWKLVIAWMAFLHPGARYCGCRRGKSFHSWVIACNIAKCSTSLVVKFASY